MNAGRRWALSCMAWLGAAACSTENTSIADVRTSAIHQAYSVWYSEHSDETEALARFRVGGRTGTNVEVRGAGSIQFNGHPMKEGGLFEGLVRLEGPGRYYKHSARGFAETATFVLTDADGKKLTNSVKMRRIGADPHLPETLSRAALRSLKFDGPPVGKSERVHLTIEQVPTDAERQKWRHDHPPSKARHTEQPQTVALDDPSADGPPTRSFTETVSQPGSSEVTVSAAQLVDFKDGPATISFSRSVEVDLQGATAAGGSFTATYVAKPRHVIMTR